MMRLNFEDLPAIFGVKELRSFMKIGEAAAYQLANRKDFPSMRIGRQIRISRDGLRRWVENETTGGAR